MNPWANERSDW